MILEADLLKELAAGPVEKRAITNLHVLNEAYDYVRPSSFPVVCASISMG